MKGSLVVYNMNSMLYEQYCELPMEQKRAITNEMSRENQSLVEDHFKKYPDEWIIIAGKKVIASGSRKNEPQLVELKRVAVEENIVPFLYIKPEAIEKTPENISFF